MRKGRGDVIVQIEHQKIILALMQIDILFGPDVLLHILVNIQMIGRQIGNHRDMR